MILQVIAETNLRCDRLVHPEDGHDEQAGEDSTERLQRRPPAVLPSTSLPSWPRHRVGDTRAPQVAGAGAVALVEEGSIGARALLLGRGGDVSQPAVLVDGDPHQQPQHRDDHHHQLHPMHSRLEGPHARAIILARRRLRMIPQDGLVTCEHGAYVTEEGNQSATVCVRGFLVEVISLLAGGHYDLSRVSHGWVNLLVPKRRVQ
mmetsp:Transcript_18605/g.61120  ORF Transcript_18605/g.61120 Transcript_18605/m.61120 type:complete len:204 (-) Transcript_18605:401-1012(-)